MILSIAATQIEMQPFQVAVDRYGTSFLSLVSGVGPVEAAVRLTRFLCEEREHITGVMLFGIGGAYLQPESEVQPQLLDICLASQEVVGDLGICYPDVMEYLDTELTGNLVYMMDGKVLARSETLLKEHKIVPHVGPFITVNGITGTIERGEMLRSRWDSLCENMEGAAVARVCQDFDLPCIELRCISNFVENRNMANWRLLEACEIAGQTAAYVYKGLTT